MALPTQKRSKSRQKRRQYQYRLKKINLTACPQCKKQTPPHQVCIYCGSYKGKTVINLEKTKKEKTKKEK
ncbi:MAG: 50S ribosomal protein L32 [Patescibacteria group bacterium]